MGLNSKWTAGRLKFYDGADAAVGGKGIDFGLISSTALLHGGGVSGTRLTTSTAGAKFISYYLENSATSGANYGFFIDFKPSGVLQTYSEAIHGSITLACNVRNPAAGVFDMTFSSGAGIQGLGYGFGSYVSFPNAGMGTGNFCGCNIEFASGGNSFVPSFTNFAFMRLASSGTGKAGNVEKAFLFMLDGFTGAATGRTQSNQRLAELPAGSIGFMVGVGSGGSGMAKYYIPAVPEAEWN